MCPEGAKAHARGRKNDPLLPQAKDICVQFYESENHPYRDGPFSTELVRLYEERYYELPSGRLPKDWRKLGSQPRDPDKFSQLYQRINDALGGRLAPPSGVSECTK